MKALITYNYNNSRGNFIKNLSHIIVSITKKNYTVEVFPEENKEKWLNRIKNNLDYDLLVLSGGDGTLHAAINALQQVDWNPNILYFPAGTVNDLAYTLGLDKDIDHTLKCFEDENLISIDCSKFNQEYFVYVAATGGLTKVSYSTKEEYKKLFGPLAYLLKGLSEIKAMKQIKKAKFTIDGQEIIEENISFIVVSNSSSIGGFRKLYPERKLADGFLDLLIIPQLTMQDITDIIKLISYGVTEETLSEKIIYRRAKKIIIETNESAEWSLDGEKGPTGDGIIEVVDRKINIYANI